ncbi:MAG: type 4a pilus biogenesis protein PilO [Rhodocyclaceae bacterium]|nr:type 4a pilus biogenesis protein PilO [Rhodocyclaceae bacterium]
MMGLSRLTVSEQLHRAGVPGVVGLALSACAAVASLTALVPAKRALEEARLALDSARQQLHRTDARTKPVTLEEQLARFYAHFPDREAAPELLERVYDAADLNGLQVARADYTVAEDRHVGLVSYQVLVPLSGHYGQIRGFVDEVLQAIPTLAVDELDFSRERISESRVDARVRLNLYMTRM